MEYGTQLPFSWQTLETSGNFCPCWYLLEKSGHQETCALPPWKLVGMPLGSAFLGQLDQPRKLTLPGWQPIHRNTKQNPHPVLLLKFTHMKKSCVS